MANSLINRSLSLPVVLASTRAKIVPSRYLISSAECQCSSLRPVGFYPTPSSTPVESPATA